MANKLPPVRESDKIARIREIENISWTQLSARDIAERAILLAELCTEHGADWRAIADNDFDEYNGVLTDHMIRALRLAGVVIFPDED